MGAAPRIVSGGIITREPQALLTVNSAKWRPRVHAREYGLSWRDSVGYFAAAHTQSAIADGLTLLLISILLTAVGAIIASDLFGFISKYRVPPSRRSVEFQEKWDMPDVSKLVGGLFLCVGVPLFILSLVGELILLAR